MKAWLFTSQLQSTVPWSEDTPEFLTSARKLSRWDRVFLSLSKLDNDLFIHMLCADPAWLSSAFDIIIRSISYFLFFCHLVKSPNPKRWLKEINALQFHQDSQVVQFIVYLFIRDLDEIIFLVSPPSNKKLDEAFSTETTLFSDCKIRIGITFKLHKFPISNGLSESERI